MAVVLVTVEGNRAPNIALTLQRNGSNIDLTNRTVKLIIRNAKTLEVTNSGHDDCTVTDASSGLIDYAPQAADFDGGGRFYAKVEITHPGSKPEILPETLVIIADVN